MNTILVDHDIEGQVLTLWGALAAEGWLEICPLRMDKIRLSEDIYEVILRITRAGTQGRFVWLTMTSSTSSRRVPCSTIPLPL